MPQIDGAEKTYIALEQLITEMPALIGDVKWNEIESEIKDKLQRLGSINVEEERGRISVELMKLLMDYPQANERFHVMRDGLDTRLHILQNLSDIAASIGNDPKINEGLEKATTILDGQLLIIDGYKGEVIINPDDDTIILYQEKAISYENYISSVHRLSHLPAKTVDGYTMAVKANIEFLEEVVSAKDSGAEGIGLYRTEFLYLRSKGIPEDLQKTIGSYYRNYRQPGSVFARFWG